MQYFKESVKFQKKRFSRKFFQGKILTWPSLGSLLTRTSIGSSNSIARLEPDPPTRWQHVLVLTLSSNVISTDWVGNKFNIWNLYKWMENEAINLGSWTSFTFLVAIVSLLSMIYNLQSESLSKIRVFSLIVNSIFIIEQVKLLQQDNHIRGSRPWFSILWDWESVKFYDI